MKKLVLKNITKKFGKVVAVRQVDLEIEDQEFIVLVGPSGCGKTTTLRMVAGLETVDQGEIFINDRMVNHLPPKSRDIAMVFQNYALYPHMNVYQNLAFGLRMRKISKAEREPKVVEASKIMGIEELLDRKPRQLSGGQRQRVALGRAIVRNPEVFLFDEPLSNLDAKLRVQMRTELKKLHQRLKATSVYVTHDQVEAMSMGDRIIVMKDGSIQQIGSPSDLYYRPQNRFVAGFIGSPTMNFLPCRVVEANSQFQIDTGDFQLPLFDQYSERVQAAGDREFILGIRPEDIREKRPQEQPSYGGSIEAHVNVTEILGKEVFLDLSTGENRLSALVSAGPEQTFGQKIELEVNLARIHLFNVENGDAII
jgi:multiple sugar transport system ATP-binding protein